MVGEGWACSLGSWSSSATRYNFSEKEILIQVVYLVRIENTVLFATQMKTSLRKYCRDDQRLRDGKERVGQ